MTIDYVLEELKVFNKIKFQELNHKYSINDYIFPISSTGWLKQFTEPFNKDYWANRKAIERGITKEEILNEWKEIARVSTDEIGSPLHKYMELSLTNRKDEIDISDNKDLKYVINMANEFLDISGPGMIPVISELVLGDETLGIAGMIDQLYINTKTGLLELWDWKTSKKIDKISFGNKKMKEPFINFPDSNYYHYSLQLNLYKYIIEKFTNLKISKLRICQFSKLNPTYEIYTCVNMQTELISYFENK